MPTKMCSAMCSASPLLALGLFASTTFAATSSLAQEKILWRRCKILRRHSERERHHHSAINERQWVDA